MSPPEFETAHYIASSADIPLEDVTSQLEAAFDLPPFDVDGEASWDYAYSERPDLGLNVTRARRADVIETWVPGTPEGSIYQIVVFLRGPTPTVDDVRNVLSERCDMETHFITSTDLAG